MKRLIAALALILLFPILSSAADVKFQWDYGTSMPSGFEMRLSSTPGGLAVTTFDCGASPLKTCTVTGIAVGTFYAKCFAYATGTVKVYSAGSNEVQIIIPAAPASPTNLTLPIQGTANLMFTVPENTVATIDLSFRTQ